MSHHTHWALLPWGLQKFVSWLQITMGNETEAASPASTAPASESPAAETGDVSRKKGSGNLNGVQAMIQLAQASRKQREQQTTTAAAQTAPSSESNAAPANETPESSPAAEAQTASAETPDSQAASTEAEEEGDPVLSPNSLSPEAQEHLSRRIGREVAKTKTMQEGYEAKETALLARISEMESKLSGASQQPQTPSAPIAYNPNVPLSEIGDPQALEQLAQTTVSALRMAEEIMDSPQSWRTKVVPLTDPETGEAILDPNTGEAKVQRFKVTKVGDQEYTEASLKKLIRDWRTTKEDHIPQRRQFLAVKAQVQQQAFEAFPFLKDRNSPEYQMAQAARQQMPWLEMLPNADWVIGVQLRGIKAMQEDAAKAKTAAEAKVKPTSRVALKPTTDQAAVSGAGSPSTRVTSGTASRQSIAAERERMAAKRGVTAAEAAASLTRVAQLRQSR